MRRLPASTASPPPPRQRHKGRAAGLLALGVLLDAFVVRMLLMPALMHLLGRSAWWIPRWLDRILPNVDVEGAALERRHHASEPTTPNGAKLTP